jgi:ubiquitin-activating enzyme E1
VKVPHEVKFVSLK